MVAVTILQESAAHEVGRGAPKYLKSNKRSQVKKNLSLMPSKAHPAKTGMLPSLLTLKVRMSFKIDTGAQCNVMLSKTYNNVSQQPLRKSSTKLVAFGGHRLKSLGKATLLCKHKKKIEFEVLNDVSDVLGLKTSEEMNLVQRIETVTNYVRSEQIC